MKEPSLFRLWVRWGIRLCCPLDKTTAFYLRNRDRLWMEYKLGAFREGEKRPALWGNFRIFFRRFKDLMRVLDEIWGHAIYDFKTTKRDPLIFDLGANIGVSLLYFKHLYPDARIYAFEPDPENFKTLQKNIELQNLSQVSLHNIAAASQEGEIPFYSNEESLVSSTFQTRVDNTVYARQYLVKAVCLSRYIDQEIDFLKMDIEGSEWDVLTELSQSGKLTQIREMAIEYHHHLNTQEDKLAGFLGMLESAGFTYTLSAPFVSPRAQYNFQDILIRAIRKGSLINE